MTTPMICPICNKEIEKLLRFGACPHCKTRLKVRTMKNDPEIPTVRTDDKEVYHLVTNENRVEVKKSNYGNFIVTFSRPMNNSWIYCPGCQSKLFKNNTLHGSMSPKCKKCKSIITYVFKS